MSYETSVSLLEMNTHTLAVVSLPRVDLYLVHDEANCQEVMLIAAAVRVLL